jgi:dTDP-glucose pyrophosphorylase
LKPVKEPQRYGVAELSDGRKTVLRIVETPS